MPVSSQWVVPNSILQISISGDFSLHELQQMGAHISALITRKGNQLVHVIFDMSEMKQMPHQIKPVYDASQIFMKHPNIGWVLVSDCSDRIARMIISMVVQMFQTRFRYCQGIEDALRILKDIEPNLPLSVSWTPLRSLDSWSA